MRRIGWAILSGIIIVLGLGYCLTVDFFALFSKRARQYKEEQEIVVG